MDICDIRKAALAWKKGRQSSLPEFCDFVTRFAEESGYTVTGIILDEELAEIRFSTAEIIRFSRQELRS